LSDVVEVSARRSEGHVNTSNNNARERRGVVGRKGGEGRTRSRHRTHQSTTHTEAHKEARVLGGLRHVKGKFDTRKHTRIGEVIANHCMPRHKRCKALQGVKS
jgi:hypothetical protein